jgi:hypothetical protein
MTIRRLVQERQWLVPQQSVFEPEDVHRLETAYERTLRELNLKDVTGPVNEAVAKQIIAVAETGVKDPKQICTLAIERLGLPRSA